MNDKRIRYCLSALGGALLPSALLLIVYAAFKLYPFGGNTISWCDMDQQVVPLLCDLKDILSGESGFFLSMANAGGMDFWGVFFFFLASPFSFLVVFVDKADMLLFMNILALLKIALAGTTAATFLRRAFPDLSTIAGVALSSAYALCGFTMLFYQNIIWLDMVWSFPLLLWSFLHLSEKKKPLFFILMLSLSMVINYYIGYMVVVFLLLAVPLWVLLCVPKEERGVLSLLFLVSCLVAALLTAVVWLPSFLQYVESARDGTGLIDSLKSGSFYGSYTTKSQILFCTPVIFAVLPFLSIRPDTQAGKRRLWCLILFILTLAASVFEPINKMWHTGNYQSFPLRYGYMIAFLGLMLTASVLSEQEDGAFFRCRPRALLGGISAVLAVFFAGRTLCKGFFDEISIFTSTLWGNETSFRLLLLWCLVGIGAFAIFFVLSKTGTVSKRLVSLLLCLAVSSCCLFNASVYMGSAARSDETYRLENQLAGKINDPSFYRVKSAEKYFVVNRLGGLGYNSLAHYTSLTDEDYMFAMKKFGYSSYWMEVNSNGGTLLTDALLRNRYTVSDESSYGFSEKTVYENETYKILQSPYDFPAAVILSADPVLYEYLPEGERSQLQEHLYQLYGGEGGTLVTRYEPSSTTDLNLTYTNGLYQLELLDDQGRLFYTVSVTGRQSLYFDAFKDLSNRLKEALNDTFSVTVNGRSVQWNYPSQSSNGLLYLGDYENETVTVSVKVKKNALATSFGVFSVDADKVSALCESVGGCDLTVERNRITAQISGRNGQYLYTCLPYDEGYSATVNGQSVPLYRVNDAFLAIPLTDGENEIRLTYVPTGLTTGLSLAVVGILALLLFLVILSRRQDTSVGSLGTVGFYTLSGLGALVLLVIYIFPLCVFAFA